MSTSRIDNAAATTPLQFGNVTGTMGKNGELTLSGASGKITVKLTNLANPSKPITAQQLLSAITDNFRKAMEKIYDDLSSPANLKQHSYTISNSQKGDTTTVTKTNLKTQKHETIAQIAKGKLLSPETTSLTTSASGATSPAQTFTAIQAQHNLAMTAFETALTTLEKATTGLGTPGTRIMDCITNARKSINTANTIMNSGNLSSTKLTSLKENIESLQKNIIDAKRHLDSFCLDSTGTLKEPPALAAYGITINAYNSLRQESAKALDSLPDYSTLNAPSTAVRSSSSKIKSSNATIPTSSVKPSAKASALQKAQIASMKNFESALTSLETIHTSLSNNNDPASFRAAATITSIIAPLRTAVAATKTSTGNQVAKNMAIIEKSIIEAHQLLAGICVHKDTGEFIEDNAYNITKEQYTTFRSLATKVMMDDSSAQEVASRRTSQQTWPPDASFHALSQD